MSRRIARPPPSPSPRPAATCCSASAPGLGERGPLGPAGRRACRAERRAGRRAARPEAAAPRAEGEGLHLPDDGGRPEPHRHVRPQAEAPRPAPAGVRRGRARSSRRWPRASGTTSRAPSGSARPGQSGADMATDWEHLAGVADELCFYRGLQAESVNHPTALYHINTGNRFGGDPAVGSWVTYGLGTENQRPARLRRPARAVATRRAGRPTGATASCRPPTRAPRCGRRARRSSTSSRPPGITREHQRAEPRPARRAEPDGTWTSTPRPTATSWPPGWPATSWPSACRRRCRACSTSTARTPATLEPLRRRRARRPTPSAASACWPAGWSSGACGSSSSTTAPGTATTTSPAPTAG